MGQCHKPSSLVDSSIGPGTQTIAALGLVLYLFAMVEV